MECRDMSFFGSLFGGSNPTLNKDMAAFGQIGGYASGLGQSDTTKASNFYSSILSGDPTQISKTLSPQIGAIQGQSAQNKKTTAEFSNRSGGNNASMQASGAQARGQVSNMVASLLGSSAGALGSMGGNLLNTGLNAYTSQLGASQQQMANWSNSILGKGITGAAAAGESFATGGLGGMAGGGSFLSGGAAGLSGGSPFFGGS